jgi:hypothetical protein
MTVSNLSANARDDQPQSHNPSNGVSQAAEVAGRQHLNGGAGV